MSRRSAAIAAAFERMLAADDAKHASGSSAFSPSGADPR
jgi:hypothetical protein